MHPVIELDGLRVRLGRREILKGLSCRLGAAGSGQAIGLLGPNGAGKSTLIQTLLGFHKPSGGGARVMGYDCRTQPREVKARIGYMPENESLIANLTAVSFLRLMGELSGLPGEAALEKAHETLFHVGLGEARYRTLGTYSLGMKQMAKLAQAIIHGPELVILDEPTNGLDPAARRRMLTLIREMKEDHGMSVVLCSHLLRDVEEVCDEAVIMKDGQIVHHADLEAERRSNRRFVELEVTGEDAALGEALRGLGIECVREGEGRWRMVLPPGVEIGELWRVVARLDLRVHKLTHRRDTLEEIFLKAVGHLPSGPAPDTQQPEEVAADGRL
jgi:ABC-2 type transport system ATP-binding protein